MNENKKGQGLLSVFSQLVPALLFFAMFAAVGVLHVTSRVLVVDQGYKLSSAEADIRKLSREQDRLKVELALMKSPARLERLAREELGMAPPLAGTVHKLGRERVARKSGGK